MTIDYWDEEVGTGITKKTIRHFPTAEALEVLSRCRDEFWGFEMSCIGTLERWALDHLAKHHAKHHLTPKRPGALGFATVPLPASEPIDSELRYACRAVQLIECFRAFRDRDDPSERDARDRICFWLGELKKEIEIKITKEPTWLQGDHLLTKVRPGRAEHNARQKQKAEVRHKEWQSLADEFFEKHPQASKTNAAQSIQRALIHQLHFVEGESLPAISTIRRKIKKRS